MSYYTGAAGDYYRGARGDIWSKIGKAVKKVAKNPMVQQAALGFVPGGSMIAPLLTAATAGKAAMAGARAATSSVTAFPDFASPVTAGLAAARGAASAFGVDVLRDGSRKRRSMNAANVHALRRALRRVDSFRNLAKKSGALPAARRLPIQRGKACCK